MNAQEHDKQCPVLDVLGKLNTEEQELLRRELNRNFWTNQFQQMYVSVTGEEGTKKSAVLGKKFSLIVQYISDRLSTGEVDHELKQVLQELWVVFLQSIKAFPDTKKNSSKALIEIDQSYNELQNDLIELRQTLARAIANEKQLENLINDAGRNELTWQARKDNAARKNEDGIVVQAEQRRLIFEKTAEVLEKELRKQKEATEKLRQNLMYMETKVQNAYLEKQVAIVKEKSSKASVAVEEILSRIDLNQVETALGAMERQVLEKEALAFIEAQANQSNFSNIGAVFDLAIRSIERLSNLVEMLEKKIGKEESSK